MRYLLIDGNNLGIRTAFTNKELGVNAIDYAKDFNPDDTLSIDSWFPTGAIHGFFKTLNSLQKMFPDRYICVVWDGKSKSRIEESKEAVEKGIVPQYYKENRLVNASREELINFKRQRPVIMEALSLTNIPQIVKPDEEADDIIASLTTKMDKDDIVVLTNDHDYFQLFSDNVKILNASGNVLTESWFRTTFGIAPKQWVDVGALMGDDGDGIHGIPSVGEKTALQEIIKHETCEDSLKNMHAEYDHLRNEFPDLGHEEFGELKNIKNKNDRPKYPFIKEWMPFTGVALAYEKNKVKIPKTVLMCLIYESRVPLAKSLKGMHLGIPLPDLPVNFKRNKTEDFVKLCKKYQLNETEQNAVGICAEQPMGESLFGKS